MSSLKLSEELLISVPQLITSSIGSAVSSTWTLLAASEE